MDGQSKNLTQEYIKQLQTIFPEAVTEVADKDGNNTSLKVDMEKLSILLGEASIPKDDTDYKQKYEEKFSFEWAGKRRAIAEAQKRSTGTLRPCPEESEDWENTENLYIEGDNLEVLKLLQDSYLGAIKMIYIDPPYNTGKDFIYKDNYRDNLSNYLEQTNTTNAVNSEASGRYHTNWLNMMYPRLKLARNLLTDDGVIFISIDDNEVSNLKAICDEIFGEDNFVGILSIENNPKGRKNSNYVAVSNDYCCIYAKNKSFSGFIENIPKNINDLTIDENGNYVHNSGKRVLVGENEFNNIVSDLNSDKHYTIYYNDTTNDFIIKKEVNIDSIDNTLLNQGYSRYYSYYNESFVENTYSKEKIEELFSENALEFKNGKIYEKNLSTTIRIKSLVLNKKYKAVIDNMPCDYELDVKTTSAGTKLKELFNSKVSYFTAPKNTGLMNLFLTLFNEKEFIVLDFFSGSGTMAEAVCHLNSCYDRKIRYIMVQLPEIIDPTKATSSPAKESAKAAICYLKEKHLPINLCELAKERIRRAGKKILEEHKNKEQGDLFIKPAKKLDIGFKVFKLDRSNVADWDLEVNTTNEKDAQEKLTLEFNKVLNILKEGRTELDLLYEVMLKLGLQLTTKVEEKEINGKNVFVVGHGVMVASFAKGLTYSDITRMLEYKPDYVQPGEFKVVLSDESFASNNDKVNVMQLFKQKGITNFEII